VVANVASPVVGVQLEETPVNPSMGGSDATVQGSHTLHKLHPTPTTRQCEPELDKPPA